MSDVKILVKPNGPLLVSGDLTSWTARTRRSGSAAAPRSPFAAAASRRTSRSATPRTTGSASSPSPPARDLPPRGAEALRSSLNPASMPSEVKIAERARDGAGRSGFPHVRAARRSAVPSGPPSASAPREVEFPPRQVQTVDDVACGGGRRPTSRAGAFADASRLQRVERRSRGVAERQKPQRRRRGEPPRLPVRVDVAERSRRALRAFFVDFEDLGDRALEAREVGEESARE